MKKEISYSNGTTIEFIGTEDQNAFKGTTSNFVVIDDRDSPEPAEQDR